MYHLFRTVLPLFQIQCVRERVKSFFFMFTGAQLLLAMPTHQPIYGSEQPTHNHQGSDYPMHGSQLPVFGSELPTYKPGSNWPVFGTQKPTQKPQGSDYPIVGTQPPHASHQPTNMPGGSKPIHQSTMAN